MHQECVLVRYRKRVMPLTAKCFQLVLTDTSHVREIPFLVSHATFLPFPYTYRLDSSRARPAQSEHRDRQPHRLGSYGQRRNCSFCVFYPYNFFPLNLTFPKQITWGMLKKMVGTPRVVSGGRRPHASYAPGYSCSYVLSRVHKNKSRQLHTMGSAAAEFEVRHR